MKYFIPLALLFFSISISFAQSHAREFEYLVDGRASSVDNSMRDRGYELVTTEKSGRDSYQYWWNDSRSKCITVRVSDGRVMSVVNTSDFDCRSRRDDDRNYSYNRSSDYKRYSSGGSSYNSTGVAYDRGYNDGLKNRRFNNSYYRDYEQKDAYADGYDEGSSQRGSHWSSDSRGSRAQYSDLEGWGALRAYEELKRRGFDERRNHKQGGTTYRTWYNSRTGQCIKTVSQKERITETMVSTHCDE